MLMAACGGREEDIEDTYQNGVETENEAIPTLSILAPEYYRDVIRQAQTHMSLIEGGRINLEITAYAPEARETHHIRLQTMLMAGDPPDMFILDGHPLRAYIQSGFLADIYELMDACPLSSRDDFFSEPLVAMEMYGGLYAFPMSFGFNHVFINSSLPQPFIDRFSQYESVTIACLMTLYSDLMREYGDDFGHLSFSGGSSRAGTCPQIILQHYMGNYVDFENQTSNLIHLDFISFLDEFHPIFEERWLGSYSYLFTIFAFPQRLQTLASRGHVFWIVTADGMDSAFSLLTTGQTYFSHSVPMVDVHSRLKIGPGIGFESLGDTWAVICIPATDNRHLAWRFSQHLLAVSAAPFHDPTTNFSWNWNYSIASPIVKGFFLPYVTQQFEEFIRFFSSDVRIDPLRGDAALMTSEILAAISRISELNDMSMSLTYSFLPETLYFDLLDQFMLGVMSSDEFARQLQNRVSLWLIE